MDRRTLHLRQSQQPRLQHIGLLQRHALLHSLNTDSPAAFVFDLKFHDCLHRTRGTAPGGPSLISCALRFRALHAGGLLRFRTLLVDLLSGSQDVSSILLNGSDRFHHGLLHTQCGRGHVGIGLLRILAGQQLEAGRAEQHLERELRGSFMEIHHYGVHLTFSGAGTR